MTVGISSITSKNILLNISVCAQRPTLKTSVKQVTDAKGHRLKPRESEARDVLGKGTAEETAVWTAQKRQEEFEGLSNNLLPSLEVPGLNWIHQSSGSYLDSEMQSQFLVAGVECSARQCQRWWHSLYVQLLGQAWWKLLFVGQMFYSVKQPHCEASFCLPVHLTWSQVKLAFPKPRCMCQAYWALALESTHPQLPVWSSLDLLERTP